MLCLDNFPASAEKETSSVKVIKEEVPRLIQEGQGSIITEENKSLVLYAENASTN